MTVTVLKLARAVSPVPVSLDAGSEAGSCRLARPGRACRPHRDGSVAAGSHESESVPVAHHPDHGDRDSGSDGGGPAAVRRSHWHAGPVTARVAVTSHGGLGPDTQANSVRLSHWQ